MPVKWMDTDTELQPIPTDCQPCGTLSTPVRCMLFDLYGTLFISDSGDIGTKLCDGGNRLEQLEGLIRAYDLRISAQELVDQLHSAIKEQHGVDKATGVAYPEVRIDRIWRRLMGNALPDPDLLRFAVSFEIIVNPVWPMPHAESLLHACKRAGTVMGIISNAQFYTPLLFQRFFNNDTVAMGFDPRLTFYSYLLGEAKPSPTAFSMAKERIESMGIVPGQVAYIGNDMRNDIVPAHQTGFQTVLFAGDKRSLRLREEDPEYGTLVPTMVITDLNQLQPYVKTTSL